MVAKRPSISADHISRWITPLFAAGHAVLWARSFLVRSVAEAGANDYTAVAYIQNPNEGAGVADVHYQFTFFDSQNVFVAQRDDGETPIMPGGVTPVIETSIDTRLS